MRRTDLVEKWEARRVESVPLGRTCIEAAICSEILADLKRLDGETDGDAFRLIGTAEAAKILGSQPATVRAWCNEDPPRFPGAKRTNGETGDWRIPHAEVMAEARHTGRPRSTASAPAGDYTPRPALWTEREEA